MIAESFARIFFRNCINIGLPIIESKDASEGIRNGDKVTVDIHAGILKDQKTKKTYRIEKYPPFMDRIIKAGGLMESLKKCKMKKSK